MRTFIFFIKKHFRQIIAILAGLTLLLVGRYLSFNPEVYFPEQKDIYIQRNFILYLHIIPAMIALLTGTLQIFPRFLKLGWIHLWSRRFYFGSVFLGGIGGLLLSTSAYGGIVATVGFASLAIFWILTGIIALRYLLKHDMPNFVKWIIINYSLTFAGVTLRIWLPILASLFGFLLAYIIVSWLCWLPNLMFAFWLVNRRRSS